ncbi:CCR4-NOT transcription complex subunit 10-like [Branchiostoma floridae]|uniref:CCR4-NOT transcription complex subunit 10 n=1 Tax=Branchiostoma floridae TaxID=7739 RepID=A0A9J7LBA6_BRAFL|nr:CCR4-NOT transcription complex subunit 10-like [Branchiostoma floridae]
MAESSDKPEEAAEATETVPSVAVITDEERELAGKALLQFESGKYDAALNTISRLEETRQNDHKVLHNRAVVEFHKSNCTKTDEFRQRLQTVCSQLSIKVNDLDGLEDVDNGVLYYNQAVVRFHTRQFQEAANILEKLFQFIEPLEETLARKIYMVLIDLYLLTYQAEKALHMVSYFDKMLFDPPSAGKSKEGAQDKDKDKEKDKTPESGATPAAAKETAIETVSPNEEFRPLLHQYKARCCLLAKSIKACKREIKAVINTQGMTSTTIFLKANFEYLRHNYRKAVKLLSSIPDAPRMMELGEWIPVMFYNNLGCIHFYMKKYNLGAFYFKKAMQENDNRAQQLPKRESGQILSGRPLHTLATNKHYELLYNAGIQLLHAGRPLAAFDCLIESVQVYHSNPRLWLRIAECCIAANKETPEEESRGIPSKKQMSSQGVVGSGFHRKLVVMSPSQKGNKFTGPSGQSSAIPVANLEFAAICLKNAAMLLPEEAGTKDAGSAGHAGTGVQLGGHSLDSGDMFDGSLPGDSGCVAAPPGFPLKPLQAASLRCSVLACSAYVALGLGDNVTALHHAQNLLTQPSLSGSLKFLGHLYAAEALISLDQVSEAIQHLNPDNISDVSVSLPGTVDTTAEKGKGSDEGEERESQEALMFTFFPTAVHSQNYPHSLQSAKATLMFNLASAHCLRSEFEKAKKCLHQAASLIPPNEIPPQAIMLGVYLELQSGNTKLALQIIKKNQLIPLLKGSDSNAPLPASNTPPTPLTRAKQKPRK